MLIKEVAELCLLNDKTLNLSRDLTRYLSQEIWLLYNFAPVRIWHALQQPCYPITVLPKRASNLGVFFQITNNRVILGRFSRLRDLITWWCRCFSSTEAQTVIIGDGTRRPVFAVNDSVPGPTIVVHEGQEVRVIDISGVLCQSV